MRWSTTSFRVPFGPAKTPMAEFYQQLDGSSPHLVFDDQLGRMFRALAKARSTADTPQIRARLDDLVLYARYVDLYHRYTTAKGDLRQSAFEQLIRHAYRMRRTMMVHTKALYRDLVRRDKTVNIPPDAQWNVPDGENAWKSSEPFGDEELASFLEEARERYPLTVLDFKPVEYSGDLIPASRLDLPETERGELGPGRNEQTFFTFVEEHAKVIELEVVSAQSDRSFCTKRAEARRGGAGRPWPCMLGRNCARSSCEDEKGDEGA